MKKLGNMYVLGVLLFVTIAATIVCLADVIKFVLGG